ncbi:MAG TPA: CvpA family protein [Bryobacteraceae bacterium]|jgi:membrane protein required for colicin V production|nr:CvpA family protein [Bryobacteraceae bacterium]
MNLLDLLLAVIVGISVATGFMAGFARVGVGFIALISGLLFGFWYYNVPAAWLHQHWTMSSNLANMLGFFIVFLMFMSAGALIGKLLSKLFKWTGLRWFDRLLGGAFGFVRGAFMAVIVVAVIMAFTPKPMPTWMVGSQVLPYVLDASNICSKFAPDAVKEAFRDSMFEIRKMWEEELQKKKKKQDQLKKVDS